MSEEHDPWSVTENAPSFYLVTDTEEISSADLTDLFDQNTWKSRYYFNGSDKF